MFKAIKTWRKKREVETRRVIVKKLDIDVFIDALSKASKGKGEKRTYRMGKCGDDAYCFAFTCSNGVWSELVSTLGRQMVLSTVNYEDWYSIV